MSLVLAGIHLVYAALLLLLAIGSLRLRSRFSRVGGESVDLPRISVIVPFRNEAKNLPDIVQDIIAQSYPAERLELILVDDHSEDGGSALIPSHPIIRSVQLDKQQVGKKAALEAGIAVAHGEWILTTDADCRLHPDWAKALVSGALQADAVMVCGTVNLESATGLLGMVQVLETHILQTCGAASLALGFPLLNTGASLAFRRSTFLEVGGYSGNSHLASGDDTFLMLAMQRAHPCRVIPCGAPAARVRTAAEATWSAFLAQRRRRASKVRHYGSPGIALFGLVLTLAQFATLTALGACFAALISIQSLLLILALRFLPEFILLRGLRPVPLWLAAVPLSLLFPLLNIPAVWPVGAEQASWKGRPLVNKKH
jgi:cellulose synthase/poly-beta-1,6-N-acetylglucosamine synthase-like glycosyltransferase